jgi:hypothetical protein
MVSSAITDLFSGNRRAAMMGIKSAVGSIFSIAMQTLSGYLVIRNWRLVFLEFLTAVPVFFLVLLFLPDTGPKEGRNAGYNLRRQSGSMWLVLIFSMLVMLFLNAFMIDISYVVEERGMGTAKQAGAVLSVFSACSCVGGFVFVWFQQLLRRYTVPVAAALLGASLLLAFFSRSIPLMYVAAAVFGLGFGFFNPGMALLVADRSRMPDEVPRMLSLHLALNGFGQFFTVYVLKGLRTVLGYGSIGYDWLGAGVLILALCFAYVLLDHRLSPEG